MRKLLLTMIILTIGSFAKAQLPKWIISPEYDRVSIKVEDGLFETDSMGISALWTMDGRCLFKTPHQIHPFREGLAVVTKKNSNELVGVVDMTGRFVALPHVQVAYEHPYFENDHLICHEAEGYSYYKSDGSKPKMAPSLRSYPFHGGYAPYLTYEQFEKRKDPHYGYYRADGWEMKYKMLEKGEEKEVDPKSISFISGIGIDNRGVAVIKNKLYLFDAEKERFEPFLHGNDEADKKRHLSLANDYDKYFLNLPSDSIVIAAKYGKNKLAILQFDKELRPKEFIFDGEPQVFAASSDKERKTPSDIKEYTEGGKIGLSYLGRKMVPAQFEEVGYKFGDRAFVKSDGGWGVMEVVPAAGYELKINKGQDVAFRHQTFETQIRLDLPAAISARNARIAIPESSGCVIDKTSRETKDTESGNYVIYNCALVIPESLPDTMTTIVYSPVSISYDGIALFERPIDIKAWHLKYYNVDPIESETSISNGVASFTININTQKNVGESDYPFDVRIEADSVSVVYEKLSETRYKCMVSNLQDGNNNLNILVTEKGCPPSIFPFEVFYTKPTAKKKTKESVVVRKKAPQASKPAVRIEL